MQIHNSEFRSAATCARTIYAREGLRAFYVAYPTTLMMNIPFTAVQFTVYDHLKAFINPNNHYDPLNHATSGAVAGAVPAAAPTPLDAPNTPLHTHAPPND